MEYLLELLNKVQQVSPLPIFKKDVIVVQNAGMQHWLNMSIAESRGISMNIDYALPAQFLWKLARTVASKEVVPDQSPYSREVLTWRIYRLLQSNELKKDKDFEHVVHYFSDNFSEEITDTPSEKLEVHDRQQKMDDLKQYQLAVQLADLFEQYLVFRPDWLNSWQAGDFNLTEVENPASDLMTVVTWQGKLWQMLQAESAYNPENLLKQASENLYDYQHELPKRISFFGLNAMAPMWLDFIHKLSEFTEVHFYHLNPCADYWGDIKSEKQAFKQLNQWTEGFDDLKATVGNPLLANLGQQGREFLALLQGYSTYQLDVFDKCKSDFVLDDEKDTDDTATSLPILQTLQFDILSLHDARETPQQVVDDSITITSAHSPLREVQGLHDWLLHQFNNDESLTPKDVLVMCPQIEQYAPYVDAVFVRGWQDLAGEIPPLPCSIADRVSKDAEPLVAAFIDLLSLPDSRFQVSQLLSFFRLNAVQEKFQFNDEQLEKISHWIDQANIHWGIDVTHKQAVLDNSQSSSQFTWQQGLSRLMRGFAYSDMGDIFQQQCLLPTIEGNDAELLGQLMLVLEQLEHHAMRLNQDRTASEWQRYLHQLVDSCFAQSDNMQITLINQAIEQLVEYSQEANYNDKVSLVIVKDFLNHHFSQPDPGRQFMIGQVTFCSMLPMRSIPFKVIAVLGLNDGDFPRQRKPQAFDIMQQTPSRIGDRSRRGDDRYLFLEALISARQALYLSYQGRNIKNNTEKQPSLVMKELFAYLELAYGWQCNLTKPNCNIRQLPMQAFSNKNYTGKWASFDNKWLELTARAKHAASLSSEGFASALIIDSNLLSEHRSGQLPGQSSLSEQVAFDIDLDELVRFFIHPSRMFAQQQLDLSLMPRELVLEDTEPFEANQLTSYLYREAVLAIELDTSLNTEQKRLKLTDLNFVYQHSGELPDLPSTEALISGWQQDSQIFSDTLNGLAVNSSQTTANDGIDIQYLDVSLPLTLNQHGIVMKVNLTARVPYLNNRIVLFRSSSAKAKDLLLMAVYQLILQKSKQQSYEELTPLEQVNNVLSLHFDTKSQKVVQYQTREFESSTQLLTLLLETYFAGQQQALLLNANIGEKLTAALLKNKPFEQDDFEKLWHDPNAIFSLVDDPYLAYFWPNTPQLDNIKDQLEAIYLPLFSGITKLK